MLAFDAAKRIRAANNHACLTREEMPSTSFDGLDRCRGGWARKKYPHHLLLLLLRLLHNHFAWQIMVEFMRCMPSIPLVAFCQVDLGVWLSSVKTCSTSSHPRSMGLHSDILVNRDLIDTSNESCPHA